MNFDNQDIFDQLFERIYDGDQHAKELSFAILDYLHTWDDLIDKDKPVEDSDINRAMLNGLTFITLSPLWDRTVANLMKLVYFKWQTANKIEADPKDNNELAKAWMLRASCYDLFIMFAYKLSGKDVSHIVYSWYGEQLEDFLEETNNA